MQRLILVRHGETAGESSIRYHGRNDVPLSETGRTQMRAAAESIELDAVDRVVASSLSRARESAQIVAPGFEVTLEDDLREVHFGRWEGLTADEIQALDPELFARWRKSLKDFNYPEGERRADFLARVQGGIDRWLPAPDRAETVLVVAHKGVIRVAVAHLAGQELPDGEPPLAGVRVLEREGTGPWKLAAPSHASSEGAAGAE